MCDSGEEICRVLEQSLSFINLVIVVNDGPKVAEAKVRFSSNVKIYLFDEFLVSVSMTFYHMNISSQKKLDFML